MPNKSQMYRRDRVVFTIGHSNHTWERFLELLLPHHIELLVDVRSYPHSRFAPWSNRERLGPGLVSIGIDYRWMGDSLGGMPRGPRRQAGVKEQSVDDWYRARSVLAEFLDGINQISQLAQSKRLALMCSEGDAARCHRSLLIAQTLRNFDIRIRHIDHKSGAIVVGFDDDQFESCESTETAHPTR